MNKHKFKELVKIIFFFSINLIISFSITSFLGISNTILFRTISTMPGDITWEVIIFWIISLIEILLYSLYKYAKNGYINDEL